MPSKRATSTACGALTATLCCFGFSPAASTANVLEHHLHPSRDGLYTDPAFTKTSAASLQRDMSFVTTMQGPTYAQPLYVSGGPKTLVVAVTERNDVIAFDAAGGAVVWQKNLGTPVPLASLPCGNINPLGITGTPIVDLAARRLYVDAMTTPDGLSKNHLIYALDVDSGTVIPGWPVDVNAAAKFNALSFDSTVQNERGALQLLNGTLYVPYGGHYGDCGNYHGWVVGVPVANPAAVQSWATRARGGGAWAVGGIASDGSNLFVATGNTFGVFTWSDGEAILRLAPGPVFSQAATDYFAPSNWLALDAGDIDIGGSGPLLIDVPGATPSALAVSLGKDGYIYLLSRANLGGIGGQVASAHVASNEIINAAASYHTALGTYVVFKGAGIGCPGGVAGDLTAVRIGATNPPTITVAWCATQNGEGSPMVTTSDGVSDAIVWSLGSEGDNRLHGFDGDTGAVVFGGGGVNEQMTSIRRYETAIAADGRIFVAANNQVYAFAPACSPLPSPVSALKATKAGASFADVALVWAAATDTTTAVYDVWKVVNGDPTLIALANKANASNPNIAAPANCPTGTIPRASPACTDKGAVTPPPPLIYYQVRGACANGIEAP